MKEMLEREERLEKMAKEKDEEKREMEEEKEERDAQISAMVQAVADKCDKHPDKQKGKKHGTVLLCELFILGAKCDFRPNFYHICGCWMWPFLRPNLALLPSLGDSRSYLHNAA